MMKGIGTDGTVFIGLTNEEMGWLLMGKVRVAPAAHDGEHVAPAVRIMYAPTYEELRQRLQQHCVAPLPPAVDLRALLEELDAELAKPGDREGLDSLLRQLGGRAAAGG